MVDSGHNDMGRTVKINYPKSSLESMTSCIKRNALQTLLTGRQTVDNSI